MPMGGGGGGGVPQHMRQSSTGSLGSYGTDASGAGGAQHSQLHQQQQQQPQYGYAPMDYASPLNHSRSMNSSDGGGGGGGGSGSSSGYAPSNRGGGHYSYGPASGSGGGGGMAPRAPSSSSYSSSGLAGSAAAAAAGAGNRPPNPASSSSNVVGSIGQRLNQSANSNASNGHYGAPPGGGGGYQQQQQQHQQQLQHSQPPQQHANYAPHGAHNLSGMSGGGGADPNLSQSRACTVAQFACESCWRALHSFTHSRLTHSPRLCQISLLTCFSVYLMKSGHSHGMYKQPDDSLNGMVSNVAAAMQQHPHPHHQQHQQHQQQQYPSMPPASAHMPPVPPTTGKGSKKATAAAAHAANVAAAAANAANAAAGVPPLEMEPEIKSVTFVWLHAARTGLHLCCLLLDVFCPVAFCLSLHCCFCHRPPRVDLKVRKQCLDELLGDAETQATYWNLVEKYLLVKLSKKELDQFVIEKLGKQNSQRETHRLLPDRAANESESLSTNHAN